MKISFVYDHAYPYTKGGAEKRIFEYAKILASDNNIVEIACMKWWEGELLVRESSLDYRGICQKLALYNKQGKRKIMPGFIFGAKAFFYALRSDADIFDVEIFPYFPVIFIRLAIFFKKRKPKIIGYWSECLGPESWKKQSYFFWRAGLLLEKLCLRSCDINLANSEFTSGRIKEYLVRNGSAGIRLMISPPCVLDIGLINRVVPGEKRYDIVYFGRLISHKHADMVADLTDRIRMTNNNIRTLIIGNGPDEEDLKERVASLKLEKNIDFLDFIDDYEQLIAKIKSAKIMVFPSEREGFGIVVAEANACGLPVLVLNYSDNSAKGLIIEGKTGFVCENFDGLLEKSLYVLDDKNDQLLRSMSGHCVRSSFQFGKEIMRKRVIDIFSEAEA